MVSSQHVYSFCMHGLRCLMNALWGFFVKILECQKGWYG